MPIYSVSTKRTRSASTTSDRPSLANLNNGRDVTPVVTPKTPVTATAPVKANNSRNKRNASRKGQAQAQDVASVDGEEG